MALGALIGSGLVTVGRDVALGGAATLCTTAAPSYPPRVDPLPACPILEHKPAVAAGFPLDRLGTAPALPEPHFGVPGDNLAVQGDPGTGQDGMPSLIEEGLPPKPGAVDTVDPSQRLKDLSTIAFSRGGLTLSGGYSTIERFRVGGQLTRIFNNGRQVTAAASYSSLRLQASLGFSAQPFLGKRTSFTATAFASRQRALGFTDTYRDSPFQLRSAGIEFGLRRRILPGLTAATSLRLSREEFRVTGSQRPCNTSRFTAIVCRQEGRTGQAELAVAVTYDRRDNPINPRQGYRMRFAEKAVARYGTLQYLKTEASAEHLMKYGDEWSIATSVEGGAIARVGKRGAPIFDRFYIGGPSLHGFDLRGVGPRVAASGPDGIRAAVGGAAYYTARVELVGHVGGYFASEDFRPSLYVEAGSAFSIEKNRLLPGERLLGNKAAPRIALGMAMRWPTPVGNVRLDVALPVVSQKGDRKQIFSFSVGI